MTPPKLKTVTEAVKKKKKNSQPTQRPPMQRVLVVRNGKKTFEWRPW